MRACLAARTHFIKFGACWSARARALESSPRLKMTNQKKKKNKENENLYYMFMLVFFFASKWATIGSSIWSNTHTRQTLQSTRTEYIRLIRVNARERAIFFTNCFSLVKYTRVFIYTIDILKTETLCVLLKLNNRQRKQKCWKKINV